MTDDHDYCTNVLNMFKKETQMFNYNKGKIEIIFYSKI